MERLSRREGGMMDQVARYCEQKFDRHVEDLVGLVRVPSVSFPGFPASEMRRSAAAVVELLKRRGLENVKLLDVPGAPPYVYGERLKAPGKPTVLLYAHYDVQPAGREELWKSPAFEPERRRGPVGERLYGRGTADDKAGIVIHTAAISSYLETIGELPVNVKIVIEGEEEIGSEHLPEFLRLHRKLLDADVLVLTDTSNFDSGVPALTVALRGMVALELEVRALNKTVHSGMWGGPVPDPVMGLAKILSRLVDDAGQIAIPGVREQIRPLTLEEEAEFRRIPCDEASFREQCGMLPGVKLLREGPSPLAQLWRLPSLTVTAIQASSRKQAANIINDAAWAKVTIRLVPDMDAEKVLKQLEAHLREQAPWGLEVIFLEKSASGPWMVDPKGPVFEAAIAALTKGYAREPYKIGCGGSIPFAQPFSNALGGAPALLIGVEDPYTNAHGENESLLLSDFNKACVSQVYLFSELAKRWRK
jgi:cysteinylglycine-S-conjugate dipeptidase